MYYYTCKPGEPRKWGALHGDAAKGDYSNRFFARSSERAPMNVHMTDDTVELLVFAPGRLKDHFKLEIVGEDLKISYTPPEGFPKPNWVHREYSRGGFERKFGMNGKFDIKNITAKYADGVLTVSLPRLKKKEVEGTEIKIS